MLFQVLSKESSAVEATRLGSLYVCMYVCMYECMYLHLHLCVVITFLRPLLQLWQGDSGEGPAVRGEPT